MSFTAPVLNYTLLAPMLIVLGGALVGVIVEAFAPRQSRRRSQLFVTLIALVAALVQVALNRSSDAVDAAMGSVVIDGAGHVLQGSILVISIIAIFLMADQQAFTPVAAAVPGSVEERESLEKGYVATEIFPLTLFAVAGMLLFPVSSDLITLFVALEMFSLPLYLMAGLSRQRRLLSQEAALKYFLLGAFSSAFFLFGAAFIYGFTGSVSFVGIHAGVTGSSGNSIFLLLGIALIAVGLLFKVGAVPFHAWSPDVYQGSPTSVTAFMAAATKVAAFGAMLRLFFVAVPEAEWSWVPAMSTIAIITMLSGSLVAIAQRDVKRMLAYSSIAHAGFLLAGVVSLNKSGLEASLFYLFAYGVSTVGGFAVVTLIRDSAGEVTDLNRWSGLGKRSPWIAATFAGFLLSFAGIPLTAGFIGKFTIFTAAWEAGAKWVVIAGVLSSAIAAFFYIRVIVLMFFKDPVEDGTSVVIPSLFTKSAIILSMVVTIVLGVYPAPVLDALQTLAFFIR